MLPDIFQQHIHSLSLGNDEHKVVILEFGVKTRNDRLVLA